MAKTIDFKNLTRRSLADALGKTERTIGNWLERGLPRKPNQRYDLPSVIDWLLAENEMATADAGVESPELERGRKARADLLEIQVREKKSELVSLEDVNRELFAKGRQCRDMILSIPSRISPELVVETDQHRIEMVLRDELTLALEELSTPLESEEF